ncbi:MAG: DUF799 domain-containing protein [Elusimicrobia bacterium]|nr:DUF799 domain-containing protein [Candidatus Obscuribacterium magneticum]
MKNSVVFPATGGSQSVIPTKVGIPYVPSSRRKSGSSPVFTSWIPTFVGMTPLAWMAAFAGMTFLFLILPACKVQPPKPPLVETVAVLPFDNESNDVDAADIMQGYVYLAMKPSAYRVSDFKAVNDFLLEKAGIQEGGQLAVVDPVKLGKDLGVQALLYGYVESFGYINIGFYTERKVALELKLVDVNTGQVLWENAKNAATRQLTLNKDEATKNFAKGLADKAVDKLFGSPLEEEAKQATIKTLATLPGYRFCGFATDDEAMKQVKRTAKGALKSYIRGR